MIWQVSPDIIPKYSPVIRWSHRIGYRLKFKRKFQSSKLKKEQQTRRQRFMWENVVWCHSCPECIVLMVCVCWLFKLLIESMFSNRLNWIPCVTVYSRESYIWHRNTHEHTTFICTYFDYLCVVCTRCTILDLIGIQLTRVNMMVSFENMKYILFCSNYERNLDKLTVYPENYCMCIFAIQTLSQPQWLQVLSIFCIFHLKIWTILLFIFRNSIRLNT